VREKKKGVRGKRKKYVREQVRGTKNIRKYHNGSLFCFNSTLCLLVGSEEYVGGWFMLIAGQY